MICFFIGSSRNPSSSRSRSSRTSTFEQMQSQNTFKLAIFIHTTMDNSINCLTISQDDPRGNVQCKRSLLFLHISLVEDSIMRNDIPTVFHLISSSNKHNCMFPICQYPILQLNMQRLNTLIIPSSIRGDQQSSDSILCYYLHPLFPMHHVIMISTNVRLGINGQRRITLGWFQSDEITIILLFLLSATSTITTRHSICNLGTPVPERPQRMNRIQISIKFITVTMKDRLSHSGKCGC
mmetsp:Transcript_2401/g.4456  ORF Transcript_2401/g.4456 Transcript_2401/m.4456 type:complete len:238 (-) Transcript_2401:320-1033(-)